MPTIVDFPTVVKAALDVFGDLCANEPERRHFGVPGASGGIWNMCDIRLYAPGTPTCPPARRSVHVFDALPCRRGADEANRRDTIVLEAVVFDVQIRPRSQLLHLRALKMLLIKKFPVPRDNDH
jgi:hypothetical protein